MEFEKYLNPEETIELIVEKKKYLPLRNEDFIKIPMFFAFSFLVNFISKQIDLYNSKDGFSLFLFLILLSYIYFIYIFVSNYYKRYLVAFKWKYILTNKRLLIVNHKDKIENHFDYTDFPTLEMEENAYGNGCIIIDRKESLFGEGDSIFNYRIGVNYSEKDLILYNIKGVKKVYEQLKSNIEIKKKV